MLKKLLVMLGLVLLTPLCVQANLLTETTVDVLNSETTVAEGYIGGDGTPGVFEFTWTNGMVTQGGLDYNNPDDDYMLRHTVPGTPYIVYEAAVGYVITQVEVCLELNGSYGTAGGYSEVFDADWTQATKNTVYLGAATWSVYMDTFDVSSNSVQVQIGRDADWTPFVSSIKLTVESVPEPATMGLFVVGGIFTFVRRRHKV